MGQELVAAQDRNLLLNTYTRPAAPLAAGILLALLSCVGDDHNLYHYIGLDGLLGDLLEAVTSTGLLWGIAGLLFGIAATTRRRAITDATILLATATVTYHLTVPLLSHDVSIGMSTRMTGPGLLVSLLAGPALGLLGYTVRHATTEHAAVAAAVACGLSAAQALYRLLADPPSELLELWDPGAYEFYGPLRPGDVVGMVVPLMVLAWLASRHHLWPHWRGMLMTVGTTTVSAAVFWLTVQFVTRRL